MRELRQEEVEAAIRVTVALHEGQLDKAGTPYAAHPIAVMRRVRPPARRVALAHDWIEDCGVSGAFLRRLGFEPEEIEAVTLLTRQPGQLYEDFIERIATSGSALAVEVKIADIEDNLDDSRWRSPIMDADERRRREKYERAKSRLRSLQ